jgi:hypothetical protein
MAVSRHRAPRPPRHCHDVLDLALGKLRPVDTSAGREDTARGHDLDPIDVVIDLTGDDLLSGGFSVRHTAPEMTMTVGDGQRLANTQQARPFDLLPFNGISQEKLPPFAGSEVARRGNAGLNHGLGACDHPKVSILSGRSELIVGFHDAGVQIQMDVGVDQARNYHRPRGALNHLLGLL